MLFKEINDLCQFKYEIKKEIKREDGFDMFSQEGLNVLFGYLKGKDSELSVGEIIHSFIEDPWYMFCCHYDCGKCGLPLDECGCCCFCPDKFIRNTYNVIAELDRDCYLVYSPNKEGEQSCYF